MVLDRARAEEERRGDLAVRRAAGRCSCDPELLTREALPAPRLRLPLLAGRAEMRGQFTAGTPPPPTLAATVREDTITLTRTDGAAVQQLDPGTYSIAVDDTSARQNFFLAGPGVTEHTENHVAVRENWTVTLQNGVYHYFSERSAARLHGSFTSPGQA